MSVPYNQEQCRNKKNLLRSIEIAMLIFTENNHCCIFNNAEYM